MSLRKAINAKCRECAVDPLDAGSAAQQIACCVSHECPLHSVRPITCTTIPIRLLAQYGLKAEQLDQQTRNLVSGAVTSVDGQIDQLQRLEGVT